MVESFPGPELFLGVVGRSRVIGLKVPKAGEEEAGPGVVGL
jgi:hypothetical protein